MRKRYNKRFKGAWCGVFEGMQVYVSEVLAALRRARGFGSSWQKTARR